MKRVRKQTCLKDGLSLFTVVFTVDIFTCDLWTMSAESGQSAV